MGWNQMDFGIVRAATRAGGNQQALYRALGAQHCYRQRELKKQQRLLAKQQRQEQQQQDALRRANTVREPDSLSLPQMIDHLKRSAAASPLIKALSGKRKTVVPPVALGREIMEQAFVLEAKRPAQFVAYPNQQDNTG